MPEDHEVDGLTRRRFLELSGVVGAGAVLAGATPAPWPNLAQAASAAPDPDCGDPKDTDTIWTEVRDDCVGAKNPPGKCVQVNTQKGVAKGYAVLHGQPGTLKQLLLVPTARIKGIECPKAWGPDPNYWSLAWQAAHDHLDLVPGQFIALGINSADNRSHDQLHIHIAAIQPQALKDLEKNDGQVAQTPDKWKDHVLTVMGRDYRVLRYNSLDNLFRLLKDNVAQKDMRHQTMVVTARSKGGYYILDSQSQPSSTLDQTHKAGTSNSDFLLVLPK